MKVTYRGHEVRIATGGRSHDDSEDPGIVLVHGSGMDRTTWQMQTRWLAHHGYRVAAIDLPGHGLSAGVPLESIAEMGAWTAGLIHELNLAPAHIVGFSLGTFVAMEAAVQDPTCAASLVLIGTAAEMAVHPELVPETTSEIPHASRLMTSWGLGSQAHSGGHPSPGTWLVGSSTALIDSSPDGALRADMLACDAYKGAIDAASSLTLPVTFVLAGQDKMTPRRNAQPLLDAVPHAQVVTRTMSGHMMPIEDPIGVREAIAEAIGWDGTR